MKPCEFVALVSLVAAVAALLMTRPVAATSLDADPGEWLGMSGAGRECVRFAVCPNVEETKAAIAHWRAAVNR